MRSILFSLAAIVSGLVAAQSGINSDCAHAIALTVSTGNVQTGFVPVNGQELPGATPVPATTCSGSAIRGSAWFSFTATDTKHWIRTEGDGLDHSSMEVFSGACGSLVSIGCFPANGATPQLTGLIVGGTYYLRVLTLNPLSCGGSDCMVWVAVVSVPSNDDCAGAIELPVITDVITVMPGTEVSSLGATQSLAACSGGSGASNDDVWYHFTATHATHFFPLTRLSGGDATVQWFSGSCGNLTSIACNAPEVTGLTAGQPYHIRMHSTSTSATVSTRALAGVFSPALNDECSGAWPIEVSEGVDDATPIRLSTINSTSSTVPCASVSHDVWLSFVAPGPQVSVVSTEDARAAIFSGSCGSLTCVWSETPLQPDFIFPGLTAGQTYYLKIGSSSNTVNTSIRVFAPPANDECTTAVALVLSEDALPGHSFGATQSVPPSCGGAAKDVWYRFTAGTGRHIVECARTYTENEIMYAEVFSGTCGALTSITCQQANGNAIPVDGLTAGSTYHIRVMAGDQGAFRVAVKPAMANDECEGAIGLPFSTLTDFEALEERENINAADGSGACGAVRDSWFRFTAAHPSAAFIAPGISGPGVGVELLSGTCGALTSLDCQMDMINVRVRYTGLTVGAEYHVRLSVNSFSRYRPMLFDELANDVITGALVVPVGGSSFAQPVFEAQNYGATQSNAQLCGPAGNPDDDTWFRFVAASNSHTITAEQRNLHFTEPSILGALHIEVYDTLSTVDAVLDAHVVACGVSPVVASGLVPGETYWYRTYTANVGIEQRCAFTTAVNMGNNDEAAGALELSYGNDYSALFNTTGATQSQTAAGCVVSDVADDDIWFKFTATGAAARVVVGYHSADLTLELFSGTPGNLTSIACSDNILVLPELPVGQTCYVRLYSWQNTTPVQGRIGLFITPSLTANSCVDEICLGPVLLTNPSIEQGETCMAMIPEVTFTAGLGTPVAPGWPRLQAGSSDGYSSCADFDRYQEVPTTGLGGGTKRLLSRSGKGMSGMIVKEFVDPYYFEYLQGELTEVLTPGEPYLVSFHVASLTQGNLCINGLGAALTRGPVAFDSYSDIIPVPADVVSEEVICTDQWVNICGVVVPEEPVDHITIGPFFGADQFNSSGVYANRSYYFIDDVVVARVSDPACITSLGDVPPLDDHAAGIGDPLHVYPNPANELLNIVADPSIFGQRAVIEVFDATGSRVYTGEVNHFGALQPLDLPREWKEGLYMVMVRIEGQAPKAARVVLKR